jgi:hypothetical protein
MDALVFVLIMVIVVLTLRMTETLVAYLLRLLKI